MAGKRGGPGPNREKVTREYAIRFNGVTYRKRRFFHADAAPPETMIATGYFLPSGQPYFAVWLHTPVWEGEFGRLTATLVSLPDVKK